jgi:hypothetical protein
MGMEAVFDADAGPVQQLCQLGLQCCELGQGGTGDSYPQDLGPADVWKRAYAYCLEAEAAMPPHQWRELALQCLDFGDREMTQEVQREVDACYLVDANPFVERRQPIDRFLESCSQGVGKIDR